jgi:hypothetical protein
LVAGQLPSTNLIKQTIRWVRRTTNAPLPNPTNFDDLQIPLEYSQTETGENFLLHDSGPGHHRMLIFSTNRNLELLATSPNWYADGNWLNWLNKMNKYTFVLFLGALLIPRFNEYALHLTLAPLDIRSF